MIGQLDDWQLDSWQCLANGSLLAALVGMTPETINLKKEGKLCRPAELSLLFLFLRACNRHPEEQSDEGSVYFFFSLYRHSDPPKVEKNLLENFILTFAPCHPLLKIYNLYNPICLQKAGR